MSEFLVGFTDMQEPEPVLSEAMFDEDAAAEEEEKEEGDGEQAGPGETGPNPQEVARRMDLLRQLYAKFQANHKKFGAEDKKTSKVRAQMGEEFLKLKLPAIMIDGMVRKLREVVNTIRAHERNIMDIATRVGKMPRKDFIKSFPSNETNMRWCDNEGRKKTKYAASIKNCKVEVNAEQEKLLGHERSKNVVAAGHEFGRVELRIVRQDVRRRLHQVHQHGVRPLDHLELAAHESHLRIQLAVDHVEIIAFLHGDRDVR